MNPEPFFSILIPSYNRKSFLVKCVASILSNNFSDYEIIISDDASPSAIDIKQSINPFLTDPRVKYIQQKSNLGMSNNWNYLTSVASGKYLIIMGDDDLLYPSSLQRMKENIESFPKESVFGFGYDVIDADDIVQYSRRSYQYLKISKNTYPLTKSLFMAGVIPFWIFHPFSLCIKRGIRDSISYNKMVGIGSDILFLMECIIHDKSIIIIPEVLFAWRKSQVQGNTSYMNLSNTPGLNITARIKIFNLLQGRKRNLPKDIQEIINGYEFRRRFLYDAIMLDTKNIKRFSVSIPIAKEYLIELEKLLKGNNHLKDIVSVKIYQIYQFINLFKFDGFIMILNIAIRKIGITKKLYDAKK
jgi:glycosyltransferase involved in cell wall biosynthesis